MQAKDVILRDLAKADLEMDLENRYALRTQPDTSQGMAQLIEPDGKLSIAVTALYATTFCATHPGWGWRTL